MSASVGLRSGDETASIATNRAGSAPLIWLGLNKAARSGSTEARLKLTSGCNPSVADIGGESTTSSTTTPSVQPVRGPDCDNAARTSWFRLDVDKSRAETSCGAVSGSLDTLRDFALAISFESSRSGKCLEMPDVSASRIVDKSEILGELKPAAGHDISSQWSTVGN